MKTETTMTVGEIARLTRLTVRTLHHYHEIGLVVPGARSAAGYRLYGQAEVERLQEVLFFRELGFGLDQISKIVSSPGYDRTGALRAQRELLEASADRLLAMVDAIDTAIELERREMNMNPEEMLEVFGDFDPAQHEPEARERWGDTDAYRESTRRTARYTKADWEQLGREADEINAALVELMEGDIPTDGTEAMDLAELHRAHISKWFYDCTPKIHAGLGQMYLADARFTENIDKAAPGLARYLSDAIAANAQRSG
jgi:DNA-binding transcriptional MerR regulator